MTYPTCTLRECALVPCKSYNTALSSSVQLLACVSLCSMYPSHCNSLKDNMNTPGQASAQHSSSNRICSQIAELQNENMV